MISKATQTYPRIHSATGLVVAELLAIKSSKERLKMAVLVAKEVFNSHFFNEEYYFTLKSTYRPKFLHIGLKFWEVLCTALVNGEEAQKVKERMLHALLSAEFIKVFVRSVSMQKGVLFEVAQSVKNALLTALERAQLSASLA